MRATGSCESGRRHGRLLHRFLSKTMHFALPSHARRRPAKKDRGVDTPAENQACE